MKKLISIGVLVWLVLGLLTLGYTQPNIPKEKIPSDIPADVRIQIEKLYSSEPKERIEATQKLGMMVDKAIPAIPFLTGILGDDATATVRDVGDLFKTATPGGEAAWQLSRIGKPAVEPLIEALKIDDSITRKNAAYALWGMRNMSRDMRDMKDTRTVEPLMAVLGDKDPGVRSNAAQALGGIKDSRTVEPLMALLKDENRNVRLSAARALEKTTENHFFEQDFEKWQSWWKKNKKIIIKEGFNVNIERQPDQEDDIREVVFNYMLPHMPPHNESLYFLSLGSRSSDPSDKFMERFQNHKLPLKKVSQCIASVVEGVKDKETGEKGEIIWVAGIRWLSRNEVEVEGGDYQNGLSASGWFYLVIRENGHWVVKQGKPVWIS